VIAHLARVRQRVRAARVFISPEAEGAPIYSRPRRWGGGGSPSCKLSNAGELPEEVVKPRRAVVKDRGVRIGPRALQVERHHEDILGAEFRAWNAQRCEETGDGGRGNGSQQVRALKAVWLPSPPSCWTLLRSRGRGPVS
jgi:hypothetical protein